MHHLQTMGFLQNMLDTMSQLKILWLNITNYWVSCPTKATSDGLEPASHSRNGGSLRWLCVFHRGRFIPSSTSGDPSPRFAVVKRASGVGGCSCFSFLIFRVIQKTATADWLFSCENWCLVLLKPSFASKPFAHFDPTVGSTVWGTTFGFFRSKFLQCSGHWFLCLFPLVTS